MNRMCVRYSIRLLAAAATTPARATWTLQGGGLSHSRPVVLRCHRQAVSALLLGGIMASQRPGYVYVASSWRCKLQPAVISVLNAAGIDCYDFRNPPGGTGFSWHEVMPHFDSERQLANVNEYLAALDHPRSAEGFKADLDAMKRADTFVLVLPCGRSAHLELGWAIGQGKRTAVLLDPDLATGAVTPELMYLLADYIARSVFDLLGWLGVED